MPILQARSREQIRVNIGHAVGGMKLIEADATGSSNEFVTDDLFGGADDHNGKWLVYTSGTNDEQIRRVYDSSVSNRRTSLFVHPVAAASTANEDTAELWDSQFDPERIHAFINQAILEATGRAFDPEESLALHADGYTTRFDIPSQFAILNGVQYRSGVTDTEVHACDRTFDETTDSDFTQAADSEDYRRGSGSLKLTVASGVSAGDFVTDSITELDLSKYTHLEGWVKATTTLAANDFVIRLDNGTVQGDSTDLEVLNVPATTAADTWTFFRVALANPESDTAIISIGLEYNANQAANTVWFDDLRATVNDRDVWRTLSSHLWRVDKLNRDLLLTSDGRDVMGYALMKLIGGDNPALLTADATASEIDDGYVIAKATGLALLAASVGSGPDYENRSRQANMWLGQAEMRRRAFPLITNGRHVT